MFCIFDPVSPCARMIQARQQETKALCGRDGAALMENYCHARTGDEWIPDAPFCQSIK
jgi:hypothetical protein